MNDMENKEKIFLAKIQLLINTFEERDDIVANNPNDQQAIDFEISDYLHLLQNEDLSDESMLEVSKKLRNARIKRNQLQNTSQLIKAYTDNKSKLAYENGYSLVSTLIAKNEYGIDVMYLFFTKI